jgi:hypothetical protein
MSSGYPTKDEIEKAYSTRDDLPPLYYDNITRAYEGDLISIYGRLENEQSGHVFDFLSDSDDEPKEHKEE